MFWSRFFELCNAISKSPNSVCKDLGFSNATATHWKKGKIPNGDALIKLANYLDCSVDYLLGKTDIKNVPSKKTESTKKVVYMYGGDGPVIHKAPQKTEREQNIQKLFEAISNLTDQQIKSLLNFVDSINN